MKYVLGTVGLAGLLILELSTPARAIAQSSSNTRPLLPYFLFKGKAAASYAQRLLRCPTVDDPEILVETRANIGGKAVADYSRLYQIDASAGFLAKRSTELKLSPDGTIKAINATVEGQGGAVIVSAVKLAAFAASTAIGLGPTKAGAKGGPPRPTTILKTVCRDSVERLVNQHNALTSKIALLERREAEGSLTAAETARLELDREALSGLDDALTLESDTVAINPADDGTVLIGKLDYAVWFKTINSADIAKLPGNRGVVVSWAADAAALTALNLGAYSQSPAYVARTSRPRPPTPVPGTKTPSPTEVLCAGGSLPAVPALAAPPTQPIAPPEANLYYRRPVPVAIALESCPLSSDPKAPDPLKISASKSVGFPQLSGIFRLPIGRGGLFGSREVAGEFDETGAPTMLKYGSNPGAADIASALDTGREAGTTLRDARADALAREAAKLKSRKDIRDLNAELDKQP